MRQTLADPEAPQSDSELLELDKALSKLAAKDARAARVVEMRFFAGMGHEEIAVALGITVYDGIMFPEEYRNQVFIAEHGSWNRSEKIGYRVTLVRLDEAGEKVLTWSKLEITSDV